MIQFGFDYDPMTYEFLCLKECVKTDTKLANFCLIFKQGVTVEKLYHVYGDNIVECERIVNLLVFSLGLKTKKIDGNPTNLRVLASSEELDCIFIYFPGLKDGRWSQSVLENISELGGILREAADCVVTEVNNGFEEILFAVEFCSALPAGNQAWQRSGRAYSIAKAKIPYLFITELGGYELDEFRNKINPRLPNPAIPFSYISYSLSHQAPVFTIYVINPGADKKNKEVYKDAVDLSLFHKYLSLLVLKDDSRKDIELEIIERTKNLVKILSSRSSSKVNTFFPKDWEILYSSVEASQPILGSIKNIKKIKWAKKVKSGPLITDTARELMQIGSLYGFGITSKDLPISFIPKENAPAFIETIKTLYGLSETDIDHYFSGVNDVAICWVNGFKPRGDDSRPDRGLLPLLRKLISDDEIVLTVVFGPAQQSTWDLLKTTPDLLAKKNGLWQVLLGLSNALLIDSVTLLKDRPIIIDVDRISSLRTMPATTDGDRKLMTMQTAYKPSYFGEHDVDSVIHIFFKYILGNVCFESLCNPPGGDWSGVSVIQGESEFRWLTLPRVSRSGSKRPDHVIQFPTDNILLSIESKDFLKNLEEDIGSSLSQYTMELLNTPPSCKRIIYDTENWDDEVSEYVHSDYTYISAAAILYKSSGDIKEILDKSKCDLGFVVKFDNSGKASINVVKMNNNALSIINHIKNAVIPEGLNLSIDVIDL